MRHLIISREFPPAAYPPGGIGTYVANIAGMLAERGEIVHVIGERWAGAPEERRSFWDGRLVVHRIGRNDVPRHAEDAGAARLRAELAGLKASSFPNQWFAWHASFLAENLFEQEGIDVVEGQEWEAPLYYLLLRRQLGLGPASAPPCVVHLHSASAFIRRYNGRSTIPEHFSLIERMEEFCIRSADALLCPSRFYAQQCTSFFELPPDAIRVIPLPVGDTPKLDRSAETWERGSICFVGRLEPRKGIIEWMKAAARIAEEEGAVEFDFVGADNSGLRRTLIAALKPEIRPRFRFHGSKPRDKVLAHLARARAAVVPSRWENFPNVCVEAMRSGLPVIATRLGGMADLIEDGRTGWLTPDTGIAGMVDGLAAALRRCLAASGAERARMGAMAADAISCICDNEKVALAQIEFRAGLAAGGARRGARPAAAGPANRTGSAPGGEAILRAGVVVEAEAWEQAWPVLDSLARQASPPAAIALVLTGTAGAVALPADSLSATQPVVLHRPGLGRVEAWKAGASELAGRSAGFWLFLDRHDTLEAACLARLGRVFACRPDLGVIALWTRRPAAAVPLEAPPCPDAAHQLVANEVPPASAFRAEALDPNRDLPSGMPREFDVWALANRVIAAGWSVTALPEALATRQTAPPTIHWPETTALEALRAEALAPFRSGPARAAFDLIDLYVPAPIVAPAPPRRRLQAICARVAHGIDVVIEDPRRSLRSLAGELRHRLWRGRGFSE